MDEMLVKSKLILFGNMLKKWVLLEDALSEVTRFIAIYGHINGLLLQSFHLIGVVLERWRNGRGRGRGALSFKPERRYTYKLQYKVFIILMILLVFHNTNKHYEY